MGADERFGRRRPRPEDIEIIMPANLLARGGAVLLLPRACSACLTRSCYPTPQPTIPHGRKYPLEDDEADSSLHEILVGTLIAVCSLAGVALLVLIAVCRQSRVARKRRLIESSHQRSIAGAGIVMGEVRVRACRARGPCRSSLAT